MKWRFSRQDMLQMGTDEAHFGIYCSIPAIIMSKLKFVIPVTFENTERVKVAAATDPAFTVCA
jgi:hypothetical protein